MRRRTLGVGATLLALGLMCLVGGAKADHDDDDLARVAEGAVSRTGDHYTVRLRSGKQIAHGRPKPRVDSHIVGLHSYDRIGDVFVFHWSDGDIDEYTAVDAQSGSVTYFDRPPDFSPNGRRAIELVVGENLESFNQRPAFNIWKRAGRAFTRIWSVPLKGIELCTRARWISDNEVGIECHVAPDTRIGGRWFSEFGKARLAIVFAQGRWRLVFRRFDAEP